MELIKSYKIAFNPKQIRIIPDIIPKIFVGKFLSLPPSMKPKKEFRHVITVIKRAGLKMVFPYNASVMPAEKASILVAIPIRSKQANPMQHGFLGLLSKESFINLIPRNAKIVKTIIFA